MGRSSVPPIYTKTGDDGTTGLLFGGRVSKADPVIEACGSLDEAVAALGLG
nr:ATP:cob(I)alamin adenosyltransferase [Actinomycetota bacterium]